MRKILISGLCLFIGMVCVAAERQAVTAKPKLTPAEQHARKQKLRELIRRKTGGFIVRSGSQKGRIVFINTQQRLAETNVAAVVKTLADTTRLNISLQNSKAGTPAGLLAESKADVAVIVVADAETPALLVAPEDRWAVVNVNKMAKNLKDEAAVNKFFASRCRKELARAFSLLCGGGSSQFPGNIMNAAKIEDLDLLEEFIPMDMMNYYLKYLGAIGVTPTMRATYMQACRQGWAPAPTNDVQKAIWEKVNANPSNPIVIKK